MSNFWAMGGYAAYVWPAYGISFVAIAGAVWLTLRSYRHAKAALAALEGRKP
ncbi:MAG TPA: heme exporter protein CcmD [Rhizomicrobium sp.]|nr:heme exporter protein CcmD [Rhizomicrobium sp.]